MNVWRVAGRNLSFHRARKLSPRTPIHSGMIFNGTGKCHAVWGPSCSIRHEKNFKKIWRLFTWPRVFRGHLEWPLKKRNCPCHSLGFLTSLWWITRNMADLDLTAPASFNSWGLEWSPATSALPAPFLFLLVMAAWCYFGDSFSPQSQTSSGEGDSIPLPLG